MSFFILWKCVVDDFLALELLICCYLFLKFCCFLLCVGLFLNEKEQNVVLLGCKPGKLHRPSSQFYTIPVLMPSHTQDVFFLIVLPLVKDSNLGQLIQAALLTHRR